MVIFLNSDIPNGDIAPKGLQGCFDFFADVVNWLQKKEEKLVEGVNNSLKSSSKIISFLFLALTVHNYQKTSKCSNVLQKEA